MQLVSGTIDGADDYVRVELMLPRLLARLASEIPGVIQRETRLMLRRNRVGVSRLAEVNGNVEVFATAQAHRWGAADQHPCQAGVMGHATF